MGARRTLAFAGACWALAGSGVALAGEAVFPAALDGEPLNAWLRRETDIIPYQVVAVSPSAVTALMSSFPATEPPGARLVVRAEAVSAEAVGREKVLSWHVSVAADCRERRIRLGETTGYAERNLLGAGRMIRPADMDWRAPSAGTPLEAVWRAACEPGFPRPLGQPPSQAVAAAAPLPQPVAVATEPSAPARAAPAPAFARDVRGTVGRAPRRGAVAVQISAVASRAAADGELSAFAARRPDAARGRPTRVEQAEVNGRTVYRALVTGFGGAAEAERFCAGLKAAGEACFVRR